MAETLDKLLFPYHHMLVCGDTGTGKTGSLVSLVKADYKLFLLDFENGFKILQNLIKHECPEKASNVAIEPLAEKYRIGLSGIQNSGLMLSRACATIDKWNKELVETPNAILVLDSLTALGTACLAWAKKQNPEVRDARQHYRNAQETMMPLVDALTAPTATFHTIMMTHIARVRDSEGNLISALPNTVGKSLNASVGRCFNAVFEYRIVGVGKNAKRKIYSVSHELGLKNPAPYSVQESYPIETGLASLFNDLGV